MLRAGTDVGEAQGRKQFRDGPLAIDHLETFLDQPLQIHPPPTHNTINLRVGADLHNLSQRLQLRFAEAALALWASTINLTIGTQIVEPMNSITQSLTIHPADFRSLPTAHPVIHRRQGQQTAGLASIGTSFAKLAKLKGIEIRAQGHFGWHWISPLTTLNQNRDDLKSLKVSQHSWPLV